MNRYLLVLLLALLAACTPSTPTRTSTLELIPCQLSAPDLPLRLPAKCGALTVFENRAAGTGRQIALNIAVIRAEGRAVEPDPLFFLAGGPGQAATESYVQLSSAFERINRTRDIVLVDQRGTGRSHPLRCEPLDAPEEAEPFILNEAEQAAEIEACLAQLDAEPAFYTTAIAMEDLDEVRAALGYERINLYGVSYGSRAALTYLRLYPDRVRTLILDGVIPPDLHLGQNVARDAQHALDLIWERCALEPTCHERFPEIREEWAALLASLEAAPVEVTVAHPVSGETITFPFTREALATTVRLHSYTPETIALLPLLIHEAQSSGRLEPLAAQSLLLTENLSSSISSGMHASVVCAEDVPFFVAEELAAANEGSYLGDLQSRQLLSLCSRWPRGEIPPTFKKPVTSEVPTLLLSGELDPVTPPAYGERAASTLPNSLHLVLPGHSHNVIYRGCLPKIAEEFILGGSVEGLKTECVTKIKAMPFFATFAGPPP